MSLLPNNDLQNMPRKYISYEFRSQRKNRMTRNQPCYCGSGKKYKNCCIDKVYKSPKGLRRWLIWLNNRLSAMFKLLTR